MSQRATLFPEDDRLRERLEAVLLHHREQFQRHTTRSLRSRFPLLHGAFAGIEVSREYRLAHLEAIAKDLDLTRLERGWRDEARLMKSPHGRLVDRADVK